MYKKTIRCILLVVMFVLTGIYSIFVSTEIEVEAASPVVERAISWAISTANDNSHGYSQSSRWGPDYDCSSFVITAFKNAGVNVGTATYTGNMRSQFTQHGFQWIPWSRIGGVSNLQRGDILLNEKEHTEIYLGGNQNVGAHSNRGYPRTGDQTGTEVSVSGYYYHPWDGILRYAGNEVCNCSTAYAGDYYVSTNNLPLTMRSGHGTGYSAVIDIPKESKVYVSRTDGRWAHVEWNGYSGYCSMEYLTRITSVSKTYNLHVWVSDTGMGNVPSDFVVGNRYYICYELIDESTGKKANETNNLNYKATETVRNANGTVFEHTYEKSDCNWISFVCDSEDTYTGTVTISGDIGVSCSVSFDAYVNTSPQMKVWAWEDDDSKKIDTIGVGQTANLSYLIRDGYTKKNLNDVTTRFTNGDGYTVTINVYNPSETLIKTQSYKNNDCTWFSFVPDKIGDYKIKAIVSGVFSGSIEKTIKAEEKEHNYSSWSITKKATCTQTGVQTRTCSICNQTQTQIIAKTEHKYNGGTITKYATCNGTGQMTYKCMECGGIRTEEIPAIGHSYDKKMVVKEATCQETGEIRNICGNCGDFYTEQTEKKLHSVVTDKAVAATCTEAGKKEGSHCSVCGEELQKQVIIPAKDHKYKISIEKAAPHKNGSVIESCIVCGAKEKEIVICAPETIELSRTVYTYNGDAPKPVVIIRDNAGKELQFGSDYDINYPDGCKDIGSYTVTVILKGNYTGIMEAGFTIRPKGFEISKVTAKKAGFTAKWKKQTNQITGYELQYSTSSKFSKKDTKTIKLKNTATSKTVLKLKKKKKYYMRIRSYKTVKVNGISGKIYSDWSKPKNVTTKK